MTTASLFIVWGPQNCLGIPIIDEQHRAIVSTINSFYYFVKEGSGLQMLTPILGILEHYTNIHFQLEEALMRQAGYPSLDEHVLLHRKLAARTRSIAVEAARDYAADMKALDFLKEWWLGHINHEDRQYAPHLCRMLRCDPAAAVR